MWLQQTHLKALFFAVESTIKLASCVMASPWNCYWAQGQTTPHCCFCTDFCQCFLLFLVIDWLDFIDNSTWHLLWLKFVGNWIWALQWKVKCSYHMIRRYTVNYELNRLLTLKDEQYWGTKRVITIFVSKVFKRVLVFWGIFSLVISHHI